MPAQAEFYLDPPWVNLLSGGAADQVVLTEYARVYNLAFDGAPGQTGPLDVFWNGELVFSGNANPDVNEPQFNLYVIGSGTEDHLEIRTPDGSVSPDPATLDLLPLEYADWSMIEGRGPEGEILPGYTEESATPDLHPGLVEEDDTEEPDDPGSDSGTPVYRTIEAEPLETISVRFQPVTSDSDSGFDILWNGELVTSILPDESNALPFVQLYLEAGGNHDRLTLVPHGSENSIELDHFDMHVIAPEVTPEDAELSDTEAAFALLASLPAADETASEIADAQDDAELMLV